VETSSVSVTEVARQIRRYLEANPDASDGIDGIRDFWIGGYPIPKTDEVLLSALEELVTSGVLRPVSLPGGRVVYRAVRE
jgi:hypothetical protein